VSKARKKTDGRAKPRPGVEEQRRLVTQAAVQLFSQRGSAAVSISDICAHADVSRPTFYRCFADKDALIDAIYAYAVNDSVVEVLTALPTSKATPAERRALVDQTLDRIFERAEYAACIHMESSVPGSRAAAIVDAAFEHSAASLRAWLGLPAGSEAVTLLLKSSMAGHQWLVQNAIRQGLTPSTKQAAKDACWQLTLSVLRSAARLGAAAGGPVGQERGEPLVS
jgi:AcrR family transcriptional regulator